MNALELVGENAAEVGGEEELEENVGVDDSVGIVGEVGAVEADDLGGVMAKWTVVEVVFVGLYFISSDHGSDSELLQGSGGGASRNPGTATSSTAQQNAAISSPKSKSPST